MNTKEAIQAMLDGKKVRDTKWTNQHEYLYIQDGDIMCEKGIKLCNFNISGIWEIYEEPKPKQTVTIEKWLMKTKHANYKTHFILEASREEIELHEKGVYEAKPLKLLDTYEVEL